MGKFILNAFADEAGCELHEQLAALTGNGYQGLEIRRVFQKNISKITIAEAKEIKRELDNAGIAVWSIGSPIGKISIHDDFEEHMNLYLHTLEVAAILEAKAFRLFSFNIPEGENPEQYRNKVIEQMSRFVEVGKKYNLMIGHENEKGIFGDTVERCLILHNSIPELGAIFDPANFVQCGQNTIEAWNVLHPYVKYLHIKDSTANGIVVPAGKGEGNIAFILAEYYKQGGRVLTLEPHLTVFEGLKELEHNFEAGKFEHAETYPTERAAFDAAASALRILIKEIERDTNI